MAVMTSTHLAHLELLREFLVTVRESLQKGDLDKAKERLNVAIDLLDRAIARQNEIIGLVTKNPPKSA